MSHQRYNTGMEYDARFEDYFDHVDFSDSEPFVEELAEEVLGHCKLCERYDYIGTDGLCGACWEEDNLNTQDY